MRRLCLHHRCRWASACAGSQGGGAAAGAPRRAHPGARCTRAHPLGGSCSRGQHAEGCPAGRGSQEHALRRLRCWRQPQAVQPVQSHSLLWGSLPAGALGCAQAHLPRGVTVWERMGLGSMAACMLREHDVPVCKSDVCPCSARSCTDASGQTCFDLCPPGFCSWQHHACRALTTVSRLYSVRRVPATLGGDQWWLMKLQKMRSNKESG